MKQSRTMSMLEATANVAVGFWIAVAAQALVFPIFGVTPHRRSILPSARSSPACR